MCSLISRQTLRLLTVYNPKAPVNSARQYRQYFRLLNRLKSTKGPGFGFGGSLRAMVYHSFESRTGSKYIIPRAYQVKDDHKSGNNKARDAESPLKATIEKRRQCIKSSEKGDVMTTLSAQRAS